MLLAGSGLSARIDQSGAIAILPSRPQTDAGATSEPDRAPLESEAIVVTGTRLHSTNPFNRGAAARSAVPIVSIDGEDLTRTGRNAIGDVLNDLPALRSTLTQANSTRIDTGAGLNMLDLRGLGTNRTLVLQNGRRHIAGATFGSAVDVNTMPVDLIDRVDIVTGGSSAVYGSDAIAGVVNFVLKRDFQGLRMRGQSGISRHGDAGQKFLSATVGGNFADGRANAAASVEFAHSSDWYASDRRRYRKMSVYSFVDIDQPGDPNGSDGIPDRILVHDARAFSISNGGTYVVFDSAEQNVPSYLFQPDGSLVRQTGERVGIPSFAGFSGGNGSNLREGKLFALAPDLERFSFNLLAHWTFSEALEPFLEAKFVRLRSFGSSFGSFFSNGAWGPRDAYRTDNPFLTPETRSFIRSTLGLGEGEDSRFYFRRNFEELGPVVQHNRRDTYRVVGGLRGGLGGGWTYEASINAARAKSRTIFTGNVNVQRFLLAIDAVRDPSSGQIVCRSRLYDAAAIPYEGAARPDDALARLPRDVAECVPLNPFGEGNISQAARDYLLEEGTTRTRIKQTVFNAYLAGDSRNWLELPGGPIGIVAGAEYRRESLRDVQDDLLQSGLTHATALPPFAPPRFASKELFGELRIPIFKDRPLLEELTLSGAGRLADYRGSVGTVFAWNAGAEWAPLRDLRFRVNRSRAIRAPNAVEAYQPIGQNFSNVAIRDPCTIQRIGSGSASRRANCLADGVPDGFDFAYSSSFPYLAGGNPDLHAERSELADHRRRPRARASSRRSPVRRLLRHQREGRHRDPGRPDHPRRLLRRTYSRQPFLRFIRSLPR